ncbi:MAG: molybdopterin oxidoreductase family protein [Planctomycetaceae bacterium]
MKLVRSLAQATVKRLAPSALPQIVQAREGAMTRELLLHPSEHGLGMTHATLMADSTTTAVCGYCSTGCGLRVHLRDRTAVGLTPETMYPVNLGMACPKGWEALRVLDSPDRATTPLLRGTDGVRKPVSWDTALTEFVERTRGVQRQFGPEAMAFISTGQIACEEMAYLGALAKFGMGMIHGDGNTRQCMATAVTAYKESFGFDAPPFTYEDFEESDCLVFVGSNPCVGHPIMWERVLRNHHRPEIIVIDPRRTETAMTATQHLQLSPKSDLVLLYAITRQLIAEGYVDREFIDAHTVGYAELVSHVEPYTLRAACQKTGLSSDAIRKAAMSIGTRERVSLWWTMGVNQSFEGTRVAQAIINIALITGNIGRPGTGANSITGQCNAMGSRLWSSTTNLFGHHQFHSPADRRKVAQALRIDEGRIPDRGSWSYDEIMAGIDRGDIRGLWVIATNPVHSWIDQIAAKAVLSKLDFLVVQDMYHNTQTALHADLLLPAAGWGEKSGTFINSERRYGLLKKVSKAPGEALSDFSIFRAISHRLGLDEMFAGWTDPEAVFRMMQQASQGQACDISGIQGYAQIDACGGIQWPWTSADATGGRTPETHRRLFSDGRFYHADGKARLIVDAPRPVPEPVCEAFPLVLLTGRGTVSQWHTQTRTSQSAVLRKLYPHSAYVEINPQDAAGRGIAHGDVVTVRSRRGEIQVTACVTATVSPGTLFIPMHYEVTNQLTLAHFDPYSRQPSYKDCAVDLTRAEHGTPGG